MPSGGLMLIQQVPLPLLAPRPSSLPPHTTSPAPPQYSCEENNVGRHGRVTATHPQGCSSSRPNPRWWRTPRTRTPGSAKHTWPSQQGNCRLKASRSCSVSLPLSLSLSPLPISTIYLSICISVSICLSLSPFLPIYIYPSVHHLSRNLSLSLSIYLSIHRHHHLSPSLSPPLSIHPSLSISLSLYPSIHPPQNICSSFPPKKNTECDATIIL